LSRSNAAVNCLLPSGFDIVIAVITARIIFTSPWDPFIAFSWGQLASFLGPYVTSDLDPFKSYWDPFISPSSTIGYLDLLPFHPYHPSPFAVIQQVFLIIVQVIALLVVIEPLGIKLLLVVELLLQLVVVDHSYLF